MPRFLSKGGAGRHVIRWCDKSEAVERCIFGGAVHQQREPQMSCLLAFLLSFFFLYYLAPWS